MATRIRIFLDTSAILAGIWSPRGAGRTLLKLGEAGAIELVTSRLAIHELEALLRAVAPDALGALALLLDRADTHFQDEAVADTRSRAASLLDHPAGARVLAAAIESEAEYFVTLDREHFLDNRGLAGGVSFPMGTPGECLEWLQRRFQRLARRRRQR